jgi:hypothetical protein
MNLWEQLTTGGTPPGPYYLEIPFVVAGSFRAPLGRPRPDQVLKTNRGIVDSLAHYIITSDEGILTPQPVTFTIELLDTHAAAVLAALSNIFRVSPWTVGNRTWSNTNGTSQVLNGANVLVDAPETNDLAEDRINIEVMQEAVTVGEDDLVIKWAEIYFGPNQELNLVAEGNTVTINGLWKGGITTGTTFTTGTNTLA